MAVFKKLTPFIIGLALFAGLIFILLQSGKADRNQTNDSVSQSIQSQEEKNMISKKTYSAFPGVLSENERIGKKAKFTTGQGTFTINLFADKAPKTVSNFIFLAKDGFYDGLIFHRVIADFMIQGGDPEGNGTGGPGYAFEDEFDSSLQFDRPGLLAMANSGPATNGSQFFITVVPTPHLNNRHTIFGEVVEGMDQIMTISHFPTNPQDRPVEDIVIQKVEII